MHCASSLEQLVVAGKNRFTVFNSIHDKNYSTKNKGCSHFITLNPEMPLQHLF